MRGLALVLAVTLPVLAADSLKVRPGLWESTTEIHMASITLPDSVTANLTPEQRARMEATIKQMATQGPRTVTVKSCVTAEQLKEGMFSPANVNDNPNCKSEIISATANHLEVTMSCPNGQTPMNIRMVLDAIDSTSVQGSARTKLGQSDDAEMKFRSRWLSASCAGADEVKAPTLVK